MSGQASCVQEERLQRQQSSRQERPTVAAQFDQLFVKQPSNCSPGLVDSKQELEQECGQEGKRQGQG